MRKFVLIFAVIAILVLLVAYFPRYVEKPVKDGMGPLAVYIDPVYSAPVYHNPLDWWQTHHFDVVNRGDFIREDCLYCHDPQTSCNNCHGYVGVDPIVEE
jgi:hypothetical protein